MKKLLALIVVVAAASPSYAIKQGASGNGKHPMAGCGLGYVLLGHEDHSQVMQILAATTNATSGNQTFGITSGTSGCTEDGVVKLVKEAEVFAEVNLDTLRLEMAEGKGEFVNSFASLLGASNNAEMVKFFQSEYTTLFPTSSTSSAEMLASLSHQLAAHPELLG